MHVTIRHSQAAWNEAPDPAAEQSPPCSAPVLAISRRISSTPSPSAVAELSERTTPAATTTRPSSGAVKANVIEAAPQSRTPSTRRAPASVRYTAGVPSGRASQRASGESSSSAGSSTSSGRPSSVISSSWRACETEGSVQRTVTLYRPPGAKRSGSPSRATSGTSPPWWQTLHENPSAGDPVNWRPPPPPWSAGAAKSCGSEKARECAGATTSIRATATMRLTALLLARSSRPRRTAPETGGRSWTRRSRDPTDHPPRVRLHRPRPRAACAGTATA